MSTNIKDCLSAASSGEPELVKVANVMEDMIIMWGATALLLIIFSDVDLHLLVMVLLESAAQEVWRTTEKELKTVGRSVECVGRVCRGKGSHGEVLIELGNPADCIDVFSQGNRARRFASYMAMLSRRVLRSTKSL